jgi:hypothetical protein
MEFITNWLLTQSNLIGSELWYWIALFTAFSEISIYILPAHYATKIPSMIRFLYMLTRAVSKFNEIMEKSPYTKTGFDNEIDNNYTKKS